MFARLRLLSDKGFVVVMIDCVSCGTAGHEPEKYQEMPPVMFAKRANRIFNQAAFALGAVLFLTAGTASAQAPDAKPPKATAKPMPAAAATGGPATDGGLKSRVESLEEQLVDMQVVVGTLESLAKSGSGSQAPVFRGSPAGAAGADGPRVDALENQVRTMAAQIQQLNDQVRSLGGTPRRSELTTPPPVNGAVTAAGTSFGSTTVTPGGDAIGGLIGDTAAAPTVGSSAPGQPAPAVPASVQTAALAPPSDGADPKLLYQTAYAYLLQKDYGAAEVAFDDFLKRYPADALAGNAQYWLGESHFVRGQYKAAAGAFLKGYQGYAEGAKAPDSLLKLAMSLDRLGQKDAACSSYSELSTKFPNAAANVKSRAQSERQRVGCP